MDECPGITQNNQLIALLRVFHISLVYICYETQLTNTNVKMGKTTRLSRALLKNNINIQQLQMSDQLYCVAIDKACTQSKERGEGDG